MNSDVSNTSTAANLPSAAGQTADPGSKVAAPAPGSNLRETLETVVFVIVLVLLLKTFVAEAFVIPTGSMATTLWGDQKWVACPQCGFEFPVNCSAEREAAERGGTVDAVVGCTCPNCRFHLNFGRGGANPACSSGDRVVVSKYLYDLKGGEPAREDVVVFKFPKEPQRQWSALNYIKRLVGLPGETVAIHYGDLYVYPGSRKAQATPLTYADQPRPEDPNDLWLPEYMYPSHPKAVALFHDGEFEIVRKAPAQLLAMRRIVYDNDHPPGDLVQAQFPSRWAPESDPGTADAAGESDYRLLRRHGQDEGAWGAAPEHSFRHVPRSGKRAWLRYRHLVVDPPRDQRTNLMGLGDAVKPSLITDFLGYNTYQTQWGRQGMDLPHNWVGDLLLECQIELDAKGSAHEEVVLELTRGSDRFQARWDLAARTCSLVRITGKKEEIVSSQPTRLEGNGQHDIRFANVDERLLVWEDGKLLFGDGVSYRGARQRGPTANDLTPASVGARGAKLTVRHLKLWRDVYYTARPDDRSDARPEHNDWTDPRRWGPLQELPVATFYVQPDHYLCLGDNSPQSADSRQWGAVPRRLMLGRALLVYFPPSRVGPIR